MRNQKGLTYAELLFLLALLCIVVGIGFPALLRAREKAEQPKHVTVQDGGPLSADPGPCTITVSHGGNVQVYECNTKEEVDALVTKATICLRATTGQGIASRIQAPSRNGRYYAVIITEPAGPPK